MTHPGAGRSYAGTMTDDRLGALEARVAALEAALAGASGAGIGGDGAGPGTDGAAPDDPGTGTGTVGYAGRVALHGEIGWRIDYSAGAVAELPAERLAAVLGALGHPARIEVVQELLRGPRTAAELLERVNSGSKGQLYHHLTALTAAGVVDKGARGRFTVDPRRVVPALVAMLSAADIAGLLR